MRITVHPSCINMSSRMVKRVNEYAWQCKDCKYCIKCRKIENEDKMVFCEQCGRGYHIYCIGLRKIPIGKLSTYSKNRFCFNKKLTFVCLFFSLRLNI